MKRSTFAVLLLAIGAAMIMISRYSTDLHQYYHWRTIFRNRTNATFRNSSSLISTESYESSNEIEKNSEESDTTLCEPRAFTRFSKEIHNFLYFAVPKTGSRAIRTELLKYCESRELRCLEYSTCGNYTQSVNFDNVNFLSCNNNSWFFTPETVLKCCPDLRVIEQECRWDALIDHFELFPGPERAQKLDYLKENFAADSFRIASLRDPIEQFMSWWYHNCRRKDKNTLWYCHPPYYRRHATFVVRRKGKRLVKTRARMVSKPYTNTSLVADMHLESDRSTLGHQRNSLSNLQSRYLGFDGSRKSLEETVFPFLESLDFMILGQQMKKNWCQLRKLLKWPKKFFAEKNAHPPTNYKLRESDQKKIRKVQWADVALLEKAKEIYERKWSKLYMKNC